MSESSPAFLNTGPNRWSGFKNIPLKDRLQTPVQYVKGVGPKLSKVLERKGIRTVEDALYFLPEDV